MKILLIILSFLALQTSTYSSTTENNKFNQKYLSNYFSALVSSGNQKNEQALKYFNSSKFLIQKHDNFLKKYVFSFIQDEYEDILYKFKEGYELYTEKSSSNESKFENNEFIVEFHHEGESTLRDERKIILKNKDIYGIVSCFVSDDSIYYYDFYETDKFFKNRKEIGSITDHRINEFMKNKSKEDI